jgi:peptidyl-prolyl cis-trans isomerase A (cyclophilin A)
MIKQISKRTATVVLTALLAFCSGAQPARAVVVVFNATYAGTTKQIPVRLYNTATPNSVNNFLNYVNANRYDGTFIHRVPQNSTQPGHVSADFVVQGGGFLLNNSIFAATGIATFAPIADEFGISNTAGTLSFAKNSAGATSQWFFNIGDNSFLNASGFTVFGRVLGSGMNIVNEINDLPTANFANAENAPGEDFDEIPVTNYTQVIAQNNITNNEAVIISDVFVLNIPTGDYSGDGQANSTDYNIWRQTYGSTAFADADGNGNGVVDTVDYVLWRKTRTQAGSGSLGTGTVPEPSSVALLMLGSLPVSFRRRRAIA